MKIRRFALPAIAAALLAACTPRPVQPELGSECIDTLLRGPVLACHVEFRFASIRNAAASPALDAIQRANIGYFFQLEEFTGSVGEAAQAALREITTDYLAETSPVGICTDYQVTTEAEVSVADTLMNYVISRSSYMGGAHGMYSTECHTYSIQEGYEIILADLFTDDQQKKIGALIRVKLCEQYDAKDDTELSEKGFFPEYIGPTENFRISSDGAITFCYNPYDIGCYALGAVEVTLTRDELLRL